MIALVSCHQICQDVSQALKRMCHEYLPCIPAVCLFRPGYKRTHLFPNFFSSPSTVELHPLSIRSRQLLNMLSKTIAIFFLPVFAILTAAAPGGLPIIVTPPASNTVSQCNTGPAQCCNSVNDATDPGTQALLGLLGVAVKDVTAQVGLGCTPISVIGLGQGANCAQQPVCCTNNNFNGLINIGCSPISL
ncbi:hydrophobin-domain-containing protein [Ramaria rubella]|nr:hydrophobin-domain-containing protein [Ramaria rubella]